MERLLGMKLSDFSGSSFLGDPQPERNTDYKKKGNGIDKRTMRLHRRSVDQRRMRDATFQKQRGIEAMSPLKELQNVVEKSKPDKQLEKVAVNKPVKPQANRNEMQDRLKKWKEEKELKKKLERQKRAKPMFKVHHVQYEKAPFVASQDDKASKSKKPAAATAATKVTRSSARLNTKPVATSKPAAVSSRLRQREHVPAVQKNATKTSRTTRGRKAPTQTLGTQKGTSSGRITRSRTSKSSDSEDESKPTSSRSRNASKSSQKEEDESKTTSSRSRNASKSSQKEEKDEHKGESTMTTENPFLPSINFERGEPSVCFLQGPSFAPVDFKFDFTIQTSLLNDASRTPDRRCSSTPLNTVKTGVSKLPTPQGLSAIKPEKTMTKPEAPINIPVLSLSTSSVSSGQVTTPVLPSETYILLPPKSLPEAAPAELPKEAPSNTEREIAQTVEASQASEVSQGSSVEEGNKAQVVEEEMETEASATDKLDDEPKEAESKTMEEVEMKEAPSSIDEREPEMPSDINPREIKKADIEDESESQEVIPVARQQHSASEKEDEKDVPYFRRLLVSETAMLTVLCDKWQQEMDRSSLSEDVLGEVRSTIGKAQLLMAQRFKQFSGLVDDCEFDRGEMKTHCSDLIGFWEMVAYQVEDVNKMFADLDKLKANNWVKEVKVLPKVKKVVTKSKASAASKKAVADRIAARQRLMAAKASMKKKTTRSKDNEKVVFEGGFFKVESPVKSPKVHCQAGSPLGAAFLRRTNNTPGSKPGSRQGTPRSQAFIPSKPRLSLQNALCTPISKLVLTESNDAAPSPGRVTRSRQGTPVCQVKPTVVSGTPSSVSKSCKEAPSTPELRTPSAGKVAAQHRESVAHPLIPGIASPHMTPNRNTIFDCPSIFTPPVTTTSSSPALNDLICLDSPLAPSVAPPLPLQAVVQDPTGSMRCFAAINASCTEGMPDVVMSPVRRSARKHHTSGQMVVDNLTDMPEEIDYGYQPNVSLL